MNQHISTITSTKNLTHDVIEVRFQKPDDFVYMAGQYIQISIPDDTKVLTRSYSLITTPEEQTLGLCVKILPDGIGSDYLKNLNPDDEIEFRGPVGQFIPKKESQKHLFVATGVGIAPIMGMIRSLLKNQNPQEIILLFGLRTSADLLYTAELTQLADTYEQFQFFYTLSRPDDTWNGLRGRVTQHITADYTNHTHYLCGSKEMVMEVRKQLLSLGVVVSDIRFEIF